MNCSALKTFVFSAALISAVTNSVAWAGPSCPAPSLHPAPALVLPGGTPVSLCHGLVSIPGKWTTLNCPIAAFSERKAVDLLWVIDNSGSMLPNQQAVIDNTSLFINSLAAAKEVSWKMGLISTDTADKPYLGFSPNDILDSTSPNSVAQFQSAVSKLGTDGSSVEMTFDPVMQALNANPTFLRKEANLAIIVVSDADDQSQVDTKSFVNFLQQSKGPSNVVGYGILGAPDLNCQNSEGMNYAGGKYEGFINATHGKVFPLCQASPALFTDLMDSLKQTLVSNRLALGSLAVPCTIQVKYQGQVLQEGAVAQGGQWVFDAAASEIVFHDMTPFINPAGFDVSFVVAAP